MECLHGDYFEVTQGDTNLRVTLSERKRHINTALAARAKATQGEGAGNISVDPQRQQSIAETVAGPVLLDAGEGASADIDPYLNPCVEGEALTQGDSQDHHEYDDEHSLIGLDVLFTRLVPAEGNVATLLCRDVICGTNNNTLHVLHGDKLWFVHHGVHVSVMDAVAMAIHKISLMPGHSNSQEALAKAWAQKVHASTKAPRQTYLRIISKLQGTSKNTGYHVTVKLVQGSSRSIEKFKLEKKLVAEVTQALQESTMAKLPMLLAACGNFENLWKVLTVLRREPVASTELDSNTIHRNHVTSGGETLVSSFQRQQARPLSRGACCAALFRAISRATVLKSVRSQCTSNGTENRDVNTGNVLGEFYNLSEQFMKACASALSTTTAGPLLLEAKASTPTSTFAFEVARVGTHPNLEANPTLNIQLHVEGETDRRMVAKLYRIQFVFFTDGTPLLRRPTIAAQIFFIDHPDQKLFCADGPEVVDLFFLSAAEKLSTWSTEFQLADANTTLHKATLSALHDFECTYIFLTPDICVHMVGYSNGWKGPKHNA